MASAIRVRGLTKHYGDLAAVDRLDLDVEVGECVALLGPNGAGKTTTVEILEGYRQRDGGDVEVLGHDPHHRDRAWRARLGIVLQSASDLTDLTVAEAVAHFAAYFPDPRDVAEVIEAVGLADKRDTRGDKLSGGQRRRLDVALGIIGRPQLLFLDEPTTGFDPEARWGFWELIRSLQDGGTTIVLTTHYLDEAEALADRVGVISRGRLLEMGPPETLGGRSERTAAVSWREGGELRVEQTDHPTALVRDLAERFAGEVPELAITQPTLEDVYLSLVGASALEVGS